MHAQSIDFSVILQIVVFLGATSLLTPAFRKLGLSAVMAFLLIGLLAGPNGIGRFASAAPWLTGVTIQDAEATRWLAEFGVVFLLFVIGLEVSTERLWALRRFVLGLGLLQVLGTGALIGLAALLFGASVPVAAITGLALALSSTAVVLQMLGERRQLSGLVGRAGFSVLLLQDLAVVPILFVVAALSAGAEQQAAAGAFGVAGALVGAGLAVGAIVLGGRFLARPLFRWAASIDSREVFLATVLLVVIGAAALAQAAGLSMALGAFLAGLLLAETEFRYTIETDIEPFKGLLLGLFFVTVGLRIDPAVILAQPILVLSGVLGLFALKAAVLAPLARAFGLPWPRALELAFLLGQAGEFGFVILAMAREGGAYPDALANFILLLITISLFLTPLAAWLGARLGRMLERTPGAEAPLTEFAGKGHVVVAGYGRVGQALGDLLQSQQLEHVALDTDAELVSSLRQRGWPIHFGDASRNEVLSAVGAERAAAIVVTMNNFDAVEQVVTAARATWPHVPVYARARDAEQARRLHQAGAALASPETVEATLQLGEALLGGLGVPDEAARRIIHESREAARTRTLVGAPGN